MRDYKECCDYKPQCVAANSLPSVKRHKKSGDPPKAAGIAARRMFSLE